MAGTVSSMSGASTVLDHDYTEEALPDELPVGVCESDDGNTTECLLQRIKGLKQNLKKVTRPPLLRF